MPMVSEANGYDFKGRRPAGRGIVEGRNGSYKLTVWAQDLKPQVRYGAYLLFADASRYVGIDMGPLPVDEKGKGEIRKDFGDNDLHGYALTDVAAVVILAKDAGGVVSPLCGYKDAPFSWRHGFDDSPPRHKEVDVLVQHEDIKDSLPQCEDDAPLQHNYNDICASSELPPEPTETVQEDEEQTPTATPSNLDPQIVAPTSDTPPPTSEPEQQPLPEEQEPMPILTPVSEELEPEPPLPQPEMPNPSPTPEDSPPNITIPQADTQDTQIAKAFTEALGHPEEPEPAIPITPPQSIEDLFAAREPIIPFKKQSRQTAWINFTPQDPVPPPTNRPNLFTEPFILKSMEEHGHLILGKTIDQGPSWFIIGAPGVYDQATRKKAKRLGFTQFKCLSDAYPSWGEKGYWLMFTTHQL